jgi:hypothetical protein
MVERKTPKRSQLPSAGAQRKRRLRERRRHGVRLYTLAILDRDMEGIISGLVCSGRLNESDATRPQALNAALARLLADLAQRWQN